MNEILKVLRKKAVPLPKTPGVYIMKDSSNNIIYIGKARALKNRVSQYFGSDRNQPEKVKKMVSNVKDFEYILTDNEFEALILECSLIKQHKPRYNILLKDDKGYHYIKVTKEDWPRVSAERLVSDDNAIYIGPYTSAWVVKKSVDEASKIFKLPSCKRKFPQDIGRGRPCLNYYIKQCCAPCNGKISREIYNEYVNEALEFLKGGSLISLKELEKDMKEASERLEFEKAANIRDRIFAFKRISEKQKVVSGKVKEQDVISLVQGDNKSCVEVFNFSKGKLIDKEEFFFNEVGDPEIDRAEFIQQYYSIKNRIPPQITLDGKVDSLDVLTDWLSKKSGKKVKIIIPQRGEQARLIEMCRKNAFEALAQKIGRTGRETAALNALKNLMDLTKVPVYIEAYDISNLAGSENVAGMVVFENGRPLKSAYRKFKIKSFSGQDDYASMQEVISRRLDEYEKTNGENHGFKRLPDLILLDGGKGHVSSVKSILKRRGYDIPLFGMVKDNKHKTRAIAGNGEEISISANREAFTLISKIQEEVHRFAISFHRQRHIKNALKSSLLEIEGIGKTRAIALFLHFKTIDKIKSASVDELKNIKGMNIKSAETVYNFFHK